MRSLLVLLGLSVAVAVLAGCSNERRTGGAFELPNTETFELRSRAIGQTYDIRVALPDSYDTDEAPESYPLLVLLDADYSFAIARNVTQHLAQRGQLPEMIVVAIAYPDAEGNQELYRMTRSRDYTPIFHPTGGYGSEFQANSGGGPAFLSFIADRLLPELERRYPIDDEDRTLSGHSFGGLFTTWALFTQPDLFARWVIISPSYWYAGEFIFDYEASFALTTTALPEAVSASVGSYEANGNQDMVALLNRFVAQTNERGYEGLVFDSYTFADDTHASIWPAGFSRGIRSVFREPLPGVEPTSE